MGEFEVIYKLYDELKKQDKFRFIFNFTLELFLNGVIPNLNENTFCYIFGHGMPVIKELNYRDNENFFGIYLSFQTRRSYVYGSLF